MFYLTSAGSVGLYDWVTYKQSSVKRLNELDDMATDGPYELSPPKTSQLEAARKHLQANLARHQEPEKPLAGRLFVIDSNTEAIAVQQARTWVSRCVWWKKTRSGKLIPYPRP